MKTLTILVLAVFFPAWEGRAKDREKDFKIDFLCCGEKINFWDPAYSNAVFHAVFPAFKAFARKLRLPPLDTKHIKSFMPGNIRKSPGHVEATLELHDGTVFGFRDGHVAVYESADAYFFLQYPGRFEQALGAPKLTEAQAVELARRTIRRLGYSLEAVLAIYEPFVPPLETIGTNTLPRYQIRWLDPRHGGAMTQLEVNARDKKVESVRFNNIVALKRPSPRVKVEPVPLFPTNSWSRLWIWQNDQANTINHEYAHRLVPVVFQAAEDWVRKFNLDLPLPISSNQVRRFYCSNNGGVPYVEMTLKNNWHFTYRVNQITYGGSPRRFFESDDLPFRVKKFAGKWNITEDQAIELARQTIARLGYPLSSLHMDVKPAVRRPISIDGMPTIPRLWLEWRHPDSAKPVEQSIEVEVDCDRGTIEAIHFEDVRLWDKSPDLGVSIDPPSRMRVRDK